MSAVQHYLVVGDTEEDIEVVHATECSVLVIDGDESYTDRQCHLGYLESEEGIGRWFRHWWERPTLWDRYEERDVVKPGRYAVRIGDNGRKVVPWSDDYEDWIELGEERKA